MLVFYNSKIAKIVTFISGFKTINLFGVCFTEKPNLTPYTLAHEEVHTKQYLDCFNIGLYIDIILFFVIAYTLGVSWNMLYLLLIPIFMFYVLYGIEYIIKSIMYNSSIMGYYKVSFEKHARWCSETYDLPCEEQHHYTNFGWFKFLKDIE